MQWNWTGNGTAASPYLILGLNVTGSSDIQADGRPLIHISYTTVFFHLINCWVEGRGLSEGILLDTVRNAWISENVITTTDGAGIRLENSNRNILLNNTVRDNGGTGIELDRSENSTIINNTIRNNGGAGIELGESKNSTILGIWS